MNKSKRFIVTAAAMAGLYAGSLAVRAHAAEAGAPAKDESKKENSCSGKGGCGGKDSCKGHHDCKGHNDCKGQGGCKSGDNGCKGKNSCKGKGGCSTKMEEPAKK